MYLLNAFSLNMVGRDDLHKVSFGALSEDEAREMLADGFVSGVGHANTAAVISSLIGMPVEAARVTLTLKSGDSAVVAQHIGPRLDEGATALPDGARIEFVLVTVD